MSDPALLLSPVERAIVIAIREARRLQAERRATIVATKKRGGKAA